MGALYRHLHAWLAGRGIGDVLFAPADIIFDQRTLLEPDLFVVPFVDGERPKDWASVGELLLVIGVLSPSTARHDRQFKDTGPEIITDALVWQPPECGEALAVDLTNVFGE
jgi:hypothetical protein